MPPLSSDGTVRAAGAVLWRPAENGVQVAVVRRPRYKDWSLPKGKAESGETAPVTAVREVAEETGFASALGRSLTTVSYRVAGRPKTVRYFAARCLHGEFVPNHEVNRLEWMTPVQARAKLTYEYDKAVLDTFALLRPDLSTVVLVRHARAGQRESFSGPDHRRPLDGKGSRQAKALGSLLQPFVPTQIRSAPLVRCLETVAPLSAATGVPVLPDGAFAEDAYRDDPACARRRLVELAVEAAADEDFPRGSVVVSSQGGVIPGTVKSLAARGDLPAPKASTPKAAGWVLSFDGKHLVQADPFPAPEL